MPWIEAIDKIKHRGKLRKAGYRCEMPRFAADALQRAGRCVYVDGPHKEAPKASEPEGDQKEKAPDEAKEPDEGAGLSAEDLLGEDAPEGGADHLSREEFLALDKADQKELIRDLGLADECDLRKSESMADAYGGAKY